MSAWNVKTFFERFRAGTLGRKTQYSTYWVNKFDGCNILCNKSTSHRRSEAGENVVAIYMGPELCIFNSDHVDSFPAQYVMRIDENEDITESGVIDYEQTAGNGTAVSILFQIGHSQYLLEPYWSKTGPKSYENVMAAPYDKSVNIMEGCSVTQRFGVTQHLIFTNGVIKKLPAGRYRSIKEARQALIPAEVTQNPEESFIYKKWWFTPAVDYVPKDLEAAEKNFLEHPPMPWHYGLTTQVVTPILDSTSTIEDAIKLPTISQHMNPNVLNSLKQYVTAKTKYGELIEKLYSLYFDQDEGQDFRYFFLLPGQSMAFVQKESDQKYYVMGDLRSKKNDHFALRYQGMDKVYKYPTIKHLKVWYAMIRGWERG